MEAETSPVSTLFVKIIRFCVAMIAFTLVFEVLYRERLINDIAHSSKQERIKGTEKATPIHTLFNR